MDRNRHRRHRIAGSLFAVSLAAPVAADILVLQDGTRLETRGPWTERGALVVFTDGRGQLRSLRARDVDLERSRAATRAPAPEKTKAPPLPPRAPILRLTEAELPPVSDPEAHLGADVDAPSQVVVYSASWCGVCAKTKQYFAEHGIAFTERDVDADPAARRERDRLSGGRQVVPVIDWGGTVITGFRPSQFRELAREDREAAARREVRAAARAAASAGEP